MGERNLLLTLSYDGGCFHGSAVQQNAATVQGALQPVLERLAGEKLALKCCSRTDAGVHARMFCVSLKTHSRLPCARWPIALNTKLPDAMAVLSCREVPDDFHARYSCRGKRYVYRIRNSRVRDPFWVGRCLLWGAPLDERRMDEAAAAFLGRHDFSAFCAAGGGVEDHVRTLTLSRVARDGEWVLFEVAGDGFLYHMVRIMAGTLLEVAAGKRSPGAVPDILLSRDRGQAGFTAPPQGLYLEEVYYNITDARVNEAEEEKR